MREWRGVTDSIQYIEKRIKWLDEKLSEMRRVHGPDYNPNKQMQGRIEGEIGGLKWTLREVFDWAPPK